MRCVTARDDPSSVAAQTVEKAITIYLLYFMTRERHRAPLRFSLLRIFYSPKMKSAAGDVPAAGDVDAARGKTG